MYCFVYSCPYQQAVCPFLFRQDRFHGKGSFVDVQVFPSISRQSAGIISPAANSDTSPWLFVRYILQQCLLSLSTFTLVRIIDRSFSTALPACRSCIKLMIPVASRMNRMINTSDVSPRKAERITAATSSKVSGLLNWEINKIISFTNCGFSFFLLSGNNLLVASAG